MDGFWRTMAHNIRNHARMCLFGVRPMANHVYGVKFLKTATNRQKIDHFMCEVDTNEEWRHRRMTSMTPRRLRCCKSIVQGQTTDHSFTACMLVRQIHTKFSIVLNMKSQFIWMYWKMVAPSNEWHNNNKWKWQQFVFFYCNTNWTKHLQL